MSAGQTVACIRWGDLYPAEYVNRLYRGVMRNVARPTRFVAFVDDSAGLDPGIEARPIPPIKLPPVGLGLSPWRKLALWSPQIGLAGDVLFLDLDVVVVGGLDALFDHEPGKMAIVRDWGRRETGNSSVMRFPAGGAPHLVADFERDPLGKRAQYRNEQSYLSAESGLPTAYWPREWCPSFKMEMIPRFPANLWRAPTLPLGARIVVFTGKPRPHEAAAGRWPAPWYKKAYKTVRPSPWLAEHWR